MRDLFHQTYELVEGPALFLFWNLKGLEVCRCLLVGPKRCEKPRSKCSGHLVRTNSCPCRAACPSVSSVPDAMAIGVSRHRRAFGLFDSGSQGSNSSSRKPIRNWSKIFIGGFFLSFFFVFSFSLSLALRMGVVIERERERDGGLK